nr:delta-sarcoglycan-like [Halyomorpha halys]
MRNSHIMVMNINQKRTFYPRNKIEVEMCGDRNKLESSSIKADEGSQEQAENLESPTRSLQIMAPSGVSIESRAGDIRATSLTDFKLESLDGAIRLEAAKVVIPGLKTAHARSRTPGASASSVFQLCSCSNGKLFLAPGDGLCAADSESIVCR